MVLNRSEARSQTNSQLSSFTCTRISKRDGDKVYERSGKNLFWSIKDSGETLDKIQARDFNAKSLSTYDFFTLYTTLPHNLR